jgi:asparagine synthase (glutamine-hydrolysing)
MNRPNRSFIGLIPGRGLSVDDALPAGQELWTSAGIALTIETALRERFSSKGTFVALDGYLANREQLLAELGLANEGAAEPADEEIVLAAYAVWGDRFPDHLRGGIAVALWDERDGVLHLARDPTGKKPVYYAPRHGGLAFSSDAIHLIRAGARVRAGKVFEYLLRRHVSGEETLYEGVKQLLPGQALVVSAAGTTTREHWDPASIVRGSARRAGVDHAAEIDALFAAEMDRRLRRCPEIGVMLSGGLDSSYLLAIAAERADHLVTYTIGFSGADNQDVEFIRVLRRQLDFEDRYVIASNQQFADHLPRAIERYRHPIHHPNYIARGLLFERAREDGVVDLLSGDIADTLFGGSNRVFLGKALLCKRLFPVNPFRWLPPLRRLKKLQLLDQALTRSTEELIVLDKSYNDPSEINRLLAWPGSLQESLSFFYGRLAAMRDLHPLDRSLCLTLKTLVSHLCDQKAMARAHGVNLEYPYSDQTIVEAVLRIPREERFRITRSKHLLRAAAARRLPLSALRRKKFGLPVPLASWLRDVEGLGRYVDLLTDDRARSRGLFEARALDGVIRRFRQGEDRLFDLLWVLINLELWQRIFLDGQPAHELEGRS